MCVPGILGGILGVVAVADLDAEVGIARNLAARRLELSGQCRAEVD